MSNVSLQREENKRIVTDFYKTALFEGDVDKAIRLYGGETYTQHTPFAANRFDGLKNYVKWIAEKISEHTRRDQAGVCPWRPRHSALSLHGILRQERRRHHRHFQGQGRQGRRVLGRDPGNSRRLAERQYDVLTEPENTHQRRIATESSCYLLANVSYQARRIHRFFAVIVQKSCAMPLLSQSP
jgi:hypothetical protein